MKMEIVQVYIKKKYRAKLAYLALDLKKPPTEIVRDAFEAYMEDLTKLEESRAEVEELSK